MKVKETFNYVATTEKNISYIVSFFTVNEIHKNIVYPTRHLFQIRMRTVYERTKFEKPENILSQFRAELQQRSTEITKRQSVV